MTPTIIVVGADKGGVGKTMVSRTLLDYIKNRNLKVHAFDGQSPGGDLVRFADYASVVDIGSVQDQMKVFDGVSSDYLTVIDLPAGLLSPTIRALDEAKLLDDVRAGNMRMVLLHVLGPTMSSIAEIAASAEKIGGVKHLLVKNYISKDSQYFDWDQGEARDIFSRMADVMVTVPKLDGIVCEMLQKRGGSFLSFMNDGAQSRLLRGRVQTWLETVWKEFDRVGIISA